MAWHQMQPVLALDWVLVTGWAMERERGPVMGILVRLP